MHSLQSNTANHEQHGETCNANKKPKARQDDPHRGGHKVVKQRNYFSPWSGPSWFLWI